MGVWEKPDYEVLIRNKDLLALRQAFSELDPPDVAEILEDFSTHDSSLAFRVMPRQQAALVFEYLPVEHQTKLVQSLADEQLVTLLNEMSPDDRTRLFEELPPEVTRRALSNLGPEELKVARQLLGYKEGSAGRFMTPKYIALNPSFSIEEAFSYIRAHGKGRETLNILFITDEKGRLLSDLDLEDLVMANPSSKVGDISEDRQTVSILATADREEVVLAFEKYDRVALPVTDSQGYLLGIITIDDVLDVATDKATEEIQKLGGMEALDAPYLSSGFTELLRKRAGWLAVLFLGEMLTATAMKYFQIEIEKASVLALFLPLMISSGGNSGSQAASLIIRSLAIRELTLSDWWRVLRRELLSGLALGGILGAIGLCRILAFSAYDPMMYGPHYVRLALVVAFSLVGIVLFGTLCGSMLPMLLRRLGFDPATASAPFVATLVDVSGIVIYFAISILLLKGFIL